MKSILPNLESLNAILDSISSLSELEPGEQEYISNLITELREHQLRLGITSTSHGQKLDSSVPTTISCQVEDRDEILERIYESLACSQFEEANEILIKAHRLYPKDVEIINHWALTSWELGNIQLSADLYKKAMNLACPENFTPIDWLNESDHPFLKAMEGYALALYQLGELDEAIEFFETIYALNPIRFGGCIYLAGEAYHLLGQPDKALEKYALSPQEPCVFYNKALALFQLDQPIESAGFLIKAFTLNPHIAALILQKNISLKGQAVGFLSSVDYAEDFMNVCGPLWNSPKVIAFLNRVFNHPLVQSLLNSFDANGNFTSPEGFYRDFADDLSSDYYQKHLQYILTKLFSASV